MIDYIQKADERYKRRTSKLKKKKRRRKRKKRTCFWPMCREPASGMGLCTRHKAKYYAGTLIKIDHSAFPYDEMVDLYKDIIYYAEEMEVDPNIFIVWLISEGINSYEEKEII